MNDTTRLCVDILGAMTWNPARRSYEITDIELSQLGPKHEKFMERVRHLENAD